MHEQWLEILVCKTWQINTTYGLVVSVHVPEYIDAQYLIELANVGTATGSFGMLGLAKKYSIWSCYVYSCSQMLL